MVHMQIFVCTSSHNIELHTTVQQNHSTIINLEHTIISILVLSFTVNF